MSLLAYKGKQDIQEAFSVPNVGTKIELELANREWDNFLVWEIL